MNSCVERPVTNLYRVEISGWDRADEYFVERAELEWDEQTGKTVALKRALNEGAVIFVRLLQPAAMDAALPVAYRVEGVKNEDGLHRYRLDRLAPVLGREAEC
ncbi:MAG TPA: hypothetical protein VGI16_07565 [Candidatus Acidoferrum sp.]|jgi:hypothetical protein